MKCEEETTTSTGVASTRTLTPLIPARPSTYNSEAAVYPRGDFSGPKRRRLLLEAKSLADVRLEGERALGGLVALGGHAVHAEELGCMGWL